MGDDEMTVCREGTEGKPIWFRCDRCGKLSEPRQRFNAALALIRKQDWCSTREDDGWRHDCVDCKKETEMEEKKAARLRRGKKLTQAEMAKMSVLLVQHCRKVLDSTERKTCEYEDGWSDERVAAESGCPEKLNQIGEARKQAFGIFHNTLPQVLTTEKKKQASADLFEVVALREEVCGLHSDVGAISAVLDRCRAEVGGLRSMVSSVQADIRALKERA